MMHVRDMTMADHCAVMALWREVPGLTLRDADGPEAVARYLARNPGLSAVAVLDGSLVGCILCGHDGRRGYLQHLAVHPDHRRQGIAKALIQRCLARLQEVGVYKSHVDVLVDNAAGMQYWEGLGWQRRSDILRYSFVSGGGENA